ncbi:TonB-dependent receptor [Neotamlana laminarinivorans]|uniref:TonB-dependent receptor n=1 Tax=Neotamlana laminarinivorans TaxID=2883124 RepID=A0A9X1I0E1_9FLAO|nr:TonB-dependent receptor [Tamlana laminarinivorans]MCB4797977.1 TonB-dependent receptor [Tamlana laminarinivorans]
MRKIAQNLFFVVSFLFATSLIAQSTITGTVIDADLNTPLPGANVIEKGTSNGVSSDFDGKFTLTTKESSGQIIITFVGYGKIVLPFNGDTNLGEVKLSPDNSLETIVITGSGVIDLASDRKTPVAVSTINKGTIQSKSVGNVEVAEIVKNTPSVYVSGQTGFGDSQLYMRGFDQSNIAVLLNGQPVNGMEDGLVYWSNWAGIADVANGVQVQRGLGSSKLAISSVGGTMNLVMKSTDRKQGGFARFLTGNDQYYKGTVSYDTGINDKGWSFSVLLDHWQAENKWADGTFGSGQTYFFSVGYKPNENHAFNFLITGAPQQHGQRWSQSLSTIEEDPKYNQHWGYTSGLDSATGYYTDDVESERTNFYHKPVMNLNWDWTIDDASQLSTVAYASIGRGGGTGDRGDGRVRTDEGLMDYYGIEQQNLADPDGIGQSGDYYILSGGEEEGNYIRRASMNNHQWFGLVTNYERELSEFVNFNVGADFRFYKGDHFRQVIDFYGLNGWANDRADDIVVTDAFSINPWSTLFDFADEDQRIAYDYSETINYQGIFSQIEYSKNEFSAFFQGALSNQSYQREGRMYGAGKSEKLNKIGYNLKGGLSYDITEEFTIFGNAGHYSRQPFLDNVFSNIQYSNDLVEPEVDNEDITSFETGFRFTKSKFRANFDFYYTNWDNRVILTTGSEIINNSEVDVRYFRRGVQQEHKGIELDLRYRVANKVNLGAYLSSGSWVYRDIEKIDTYSDDDGSLISTAEGEDISGVHVTTAPQFTAGAVFDAEIIEGLRIDGNWNYYANHYQNEIDFSDSDIETEDAGVLPAYFLLDAGIEYGFNFGDNKLTVRANGYNLLDKIALQNTDVFGYYNTNGFTWNASVKYEF